MRLYLPPNREWVGNRGQVIKVHTQHRHRVFIADSKEEFRTSNSASLALGWDLQKAADPS